MPAANRAAKAAAPESSLPDAPPPAASIDSSPGLHLQRQPRVRISVLREIPEDPGLRNDWNALASQAQRPQIFYTYEWARAVQLALSELLHPLLVLARDEKQQLIGVAALAVSDAGQVSFLCATTGDYCDFLVRDQNAAIFAGEALKTLRQQGFRDMVLTNFPEDSPSFTALRRAASNSGFRMYARTAYQCAQIQISAIPTNAAGKLQLPRQKMVRRCLKAMSEGGPVAIVHDDTSEQVEPSLPEFFRTHVARFLFTGRISNLVRPERRKFLSDLARLLSNTGWLCMSQIRTGPRTISWNYGFRFEKNWFWYQPTFVNDLEKYSPGFVLLCKLIEDAASDPSFVTVDMGLGVEGYKERFANVSRRTMYVTLHRSILRHWKEIARYRVAAAITAIPRAEKAARELVAAAQVLRLRFRQTGLKSTLAWGLRRGRSLISWKEEVFFFEADSGAGKPSPQFMLQPITYDVLADAAIQCFDDARTLSYLVRCGLRLRSGAAQGFALTDAAGHILHLAWVAAFDGFFLAELQHKLNCPDPARVLLFDCWTPVHERGHGHYAETIQRIARLQLAEGKRPWIFSAASNTSSRSGVDKAGFQLRFSLVSRNTLRWQRIERRSAAPQPVSPAEAAARV